MASKPPTVGTREEQQAERAVQLRGSLDQYARLMIKADNGHLRAHELDQMFLTAIAMRKKAWELGLTNTQLELMLEETIRCLDESHRQTSS